jgi:hypothetical protein
MRQVGRRFGISLFENPSSTAPVYAIELIIHLHTPHNAHLHSKRTIYISLRHTDNNSTEDRYVVIIDFWHPELTEDERTALDFVYDTRNKFETGEMCGQ